MSRSIASIARAVANGASYVDVAHAAGITALSVQRICASRNIVSHHSIPFRDEMRLRRARLKIAYLRLGKTHVQDRAL